MSDFSPSKSFFKTVINCLTGKILFPKSENGMNLRMNDGQVFKVFRHVIIKSNNRNENNAVYIVRFKTKNMSAKANQRFSIFPIPLFIGLPGFLEKYWTVNEETGFSQGIYQWESKEFAEKYSKSFFFRFMSKRSESNSISFKILDRKNINTYIKELK